MNSFKAGFPARLISARRFALAVPARLKPGSSRLPALSVPTAVVLLFALAVLVAGVSLLQFAGPRPDSANTASAAPIEEGSAQPPNPARSAAAWEPELASTSEHRERGNGELGDGLADGVGPATEEASSIAGSPGLQPTQRPFADVLAEPPAPDGTDAEGSAVAVAETAEEIIALEEIQRREVEADLARPSMEKTAAITAASSPRIAAQATTWVNLRSGPSDDAEVLMVVPGAAEIQAESGCDWCAVTYDGREGYIYKNFISYE